MQLLIELKMEIIFTMTQRKMRPVMELWKRMFLVSGLGMLTYLISDPQISGFCK
jgi:hypothetical protein